MPSGGAGVHRVGLQASSRTGDVGFGGQRLGAGWQTASAKCGEGGHAAAQTMCSERAEGMPQRAVMGYRRHNKRHATASFVYQLC